ncbi:alpha/beta hydrolase [Bacteroidia bacterium]|nr:alpha/beta hydrolase [Bacteroidia bacterium]GHV43165.1 alpha/beta hydrolase [Bacteroidia bacterium]
MLRIFFLLISVFFTIAFSAQTESKITLRTAKGTVIYGTIQMPDNKDTMPLAIIIPDFKTADKNQSDLIDISIKTLSDSLCSKGIACLRYDKRGTGKSIVSGDELFNLSFDTQIDDVLEWVNRFANNAKFTEIILIGYGEGALVGMLAAEKNNLIQKFVSLAGAGMSAACVLQEQIDCKFESFPQKKQISYELINNWQNGKKNDIIPTYLHTVFPPNMQQYMISWFTYNPQTEITKLKIPILLIHGTTDAQVSVSNATLLAQANSNAKTVLIENMNHQLRQCSSTHQLSQYAANCKQNMPVKSEVCTAIANFIFQR